MDKISTLQNFSLNRNAIRVAIETFKMRKTMDVVVEMLGNEPTLTQIPPPLTSIEANLELALVDTNQTKVIPCHGRHSSF